MQSPPSSFAFSFVFILMYVKDAGWYDINSTAVENDGYCRLVPSSTLWPSSADGAGFQPIINYVHSLGLKFGFHIFKFGGEILSLVRELLFDFFFIYF
jgi:hypothetical protein